MIVKKIYTDANNKGTILCEQCGRTRILDVTNLKQSNKPLKVRCKCGYVFAIMIETRKYYRKKTELLGHYALLSSQNPVTFPEDDIIVEDVSRTGIGIRTKRKHSLKCGDVIVVMFTLDDKKQSQIRKRAIVRNTKEYFIGAEFIDVDDYSEDNRTLGFYLMPS